ncbi:peptidoglycan binding domain-containing protein [Anaerococcus sp. AGMB00486]|uniref:Peptidoglycan binding domain-containing protein n=2 Tax=Anaerococcus TaxID=165779 RepID=A0ABX2N853_9FIRM|nr:MULTISPECIES: L,D-transpeptidase family protein [Anaerococcus]MSS77322.1 L,D-transpeptidase family protein [Anaerococcus porci]NVF10876.1 peptidoglycan binding domain-containing protein [Anaerococcus faecalis]
MLIITNEDKKTSIRHKILVFALIVLGIYIIGGVIFNFITLPNTYVNGKNVSFASKDTVVGDSVDDFEINIEGEDERKLNFKSQDVDYKANIPKEASLDQNPLKWPISFFTKENYKFDYNINYDDNKLEEIIKSSELMNNITKPKDAEIAYDGQKFILKKEVLGNEIDYNKLKSAVVDALQTRNANIKLDDSFYNRPKRLANDSNIKKELKDANEVLALSFKFNINGFDKKIEGETLAGMIEDKDGKLSLNYEKVYSYVENMAEETNTYGRNRKFKATDIGEITVNPGVYGFKLNIDETINSLYDAFNQRKSQEIEPVYERYGLKRLEDGTDLGNTYVEVDLSRQHMWYYRDGELLLSTDIVTGRLSENALTNVGVGSILSKERKSTLKGTDFDGSKYETPVEYWMPIGWDGEGFHDAPWRGAFGGNIYQNNGSHGCLNMPPSQAQKLFELVDVNTPVVVYESSTSYSPQMAY